MKVSRWLILLLLACPVMAADIDDLGYHVLNLCHIDQTGVAQLTLAELDSIIQLNYELVQSRGRCFVNDTVIDLTKGQLLYSLPGDFNEIPGKVLEFCILFVKKNSRDTVIYPMITGRDIGVYEQTLGTDNITEIDGQAQYVWASNSQLFVWPPPQGSHDSVMIGYQALDTNITASGAGSSIDILPICYKGLVYLTCADVKYKLGLPVEGDRWMALYRQTMGIQ